MYKLFPLKRHSTYRLVDLGSFRGKEYVETYTFTFRISKVFVRIVVNVLSLLLFRFYYLKTLREKRNG